MKYQLEAYLLLQLWESRTYFKGGRGDGNLGGRRMAEMEQSLVDMKEMFKKMARFFQREFQQPTAGNSRDEET